ncbi:MAG: tetratricopeptide repeat protein, partial [Sphingobacteriales bacterium]
MHRVIFVCWIFLMASPRAFAQDNELNVLLQALKSGKEDTARISLLHSIQDAYLDVDNDSALYYNKMAEKLIDLLKAEPQRHRCYHAFVKIYHAKFDNEKALEYCLKGIAAAQGTGNLFDKASSYRALFSIYYNLRKRDSAIKYAMYAVDLTEKIRDTGNLASMYGNLSRIYQGMELYDKAIEFGKKGMEQGEKYKDYKGMLISMNNVGNCYISISQYKDAINIFERQLIDGQRYKRMRSVFNALMNLGISYYNLVDKENLHRIANQMRAMESSFDAGDKSGHSFKYLVYGYDGQLQNKFAEAETALLKGLSLAEADSLPSLSTIYMALSTIKYCENDFVKATYYDEKWSEMDKLERSEEMAEY